MRFKPSAQGLELPPLTALSLSPLHDLAEKQASAAPSLPPSNHLLQFRWRDDGLNDHLGTQLTLKQIYGSEGRNGNLGWRAGTETSAGDDEKCMCLEFGDAL
jgi:hypothetical protein